MHSRDTFAHHGTPWHGLRSSPATHLRPPRGPHPAVPPPFFSARCSAFSYPRSLVMPSSLSASFTPLLAPSLLLIICPCRRVRIHPTHKDGRKIANATLIAGQGEGRHLTPQREGMRCQTASRGEPMFAPPEVVG